MKTMRVRFNIATVLGYPENIDEDLSADLASNPNKIAFLTLVVDHPNSSSTYDVSIILSLKFYAKVYDLRSPG